VGLAIGYKASAEQFGPRELLEYAVEAERRGFDSVMVSDHLQPWRHIGGHAPFSMSWLAAVGERTSRVVLGTSVLTPTFRYHPVVVAHAFATMGCMFPGRVMLGIGTGEALNEVCATGMTWPPFKERFARLREAVGLIRRLWTEQRVSAVGDYYQTVDVTIYDRPDQPVPIYIAAGGPTMARYAGRAGDGFICTSGKGMDLYTAKLMPAVEEGLAARDDRPDQFDRMIEIKLSFDTDADRALEDTRFWAPLSLTAEQKAALEDPAKMEQAADELPIEQVAKRWIVASDPDEAVAAIRPYLDAGLNHLVFHAPGHDQSRFLTLFEEHLMPRIRALAS
jgi:coenzyme F420-dependent glucose-6-phosphate dehydrogenase